jgi:hypothetical protein
LQANFDEIQRISYQNTRCSTDVTSPEIGRHCALNPRKSWLYRGIMVQSDYAFSSEMKTKISESLLNGASPLFPLRRKSYYRIRKIPDRLLGQRYLGQQPDEHSGPAQPCSQSPRNSRDFDRIGQSLKSWSSVSNVLVMGDLSSESGPEDGSLISCKKGV